MQTYSRSLLAALPDAWPEADFVAMVAPEAAGSLDSRITTITPRLGIDHGLARRLRSTVPVRGADVIHGLDTDAPLAGAPRVVTVHDLALFDVPDAFSRVGARVKRALVAASIRRADAIVSVSAFTAERVHARFGRDSVVVLEAPAADLGPATADAIAAVRERHGLAERFVLHLGNLEPRKDLATLTAACRVAGVPLVLAGGAINTVAVADDVQVLGYVPADELAALYGAATVVAYVSRYEGFALPPLEAMACGAVVMATPVGALPDIAGGGIEFVEIGSVGAQAHALSELFHDADRRAERATAARAAAGALSWARAASETVAVYRTLV